MIISQKNLTDSSKTVLLCIQNEKFDSSYRKQQRLTSLLLFWALSAQIYLIPQIQIPQRGNLCL